MIKRERNRRGFRQLGNKKLAGAERKANRSMKRRLCQKGGNRGKKG